jgi:two-component system, NarL family, response regulator NreC
MNQFKVLIIEDHHLIVDGYKAMLKLNNCNLDYLKIARDCQQAYEILSMRNEQSFDLAFVDWNLPPYEARKLYSGRDIIGLIRKHSPLCKLIVLTSHTEAFLIYEIIKDIGPDALLCKVDFMLEDFANIYIRITNGEVCYSRTVVEQVKHLTTRKEYLDNYNRQIITLLSKGVKTKSLPLYLPLSISSIDKRKAQIRDYFLLNNGNDEDIVTAAKREGFI